MTRMLLIGSALATALLATTLLATAPADAQTYNYGRGAPQMYAQALVQASLNGADSPIMVREQASVAGPEITLGDLFRNIGERAATRVAVSPAPGERQVFDAYSLANIANSYGLNWQPSRWDRVVVERPGQRIDGRRLESELTRAVARQIKGRGYEVELDNRAFGVTLPAGVTEPRFDQIRIDERSRTVSALVAVPETGDGTRMVAISAKLHPLVDMPVLRVPVMPGTAIEPSDIEWMPVRASSMNQPVATDMKALVGLMPKRPIIPGEPVKLRDLERRMLIQRGATVTLLLRSGAMQLTTQAKATEDGAEGGTVRVQNLQSQITVEAMVIGPDTVEVRLAGWQPERVAANRY